MAWQFGWQMCLGETFTYKSGQVVQGKFRMGGMLGTNICAKTFYFAKPQTINDPRRPIPKIKKTQSHQWLKG